MDAARGSLMFISYSMDGSALTVSQGTETVSSDCSGSISASPRRHNEIDTTQAGDQVRNQPLPLNPGDLCTEHEAGRRTRATHGYCCRRWVE